MDRHFSILGGDNGYYRHVCVVPHVQFPFLSMGGSIELVGRRVPKIMTKNPKLGENEISENFLASNVTLAFGSNL